MDMESPWIDLYAPLRSFVTKRVPSGVDPADVVQEVFARIQAGLPTLRDNDRIDAWMFQIARNVIADVFRARARSEAHAARSFSDDPGSDAPGSADDRSGVVALTACLGSLIAQLASPYRDAVEQTELRGLTQTSAAKAAGISVSGMKSRVQRGREHLKEIILASCHVELDVRGGVIECEPRSATGCGDRVRPSPCSSDS